MTRAGCSPTWRRAEPAVHLAPPGRVRRSDRRRQRRRSCRRRIIGPCTIRFASFIGRSANRQMQAQILKEALEHATGSNPQLRLPPSLPKDGSR